jgi:hypothetical protein
MGDKYEFKFSERYAHAAGMVGCFAYATVRPKIDDTGKLTAYVAATNSRSVALQIAGVLVAEDVSFTVEIFA